MSDKSAAYSFAKIFRILAEDVTSERKILARKIMMVAREFDFCPSDMDVIQSLKALGLTYIGIHPDAPEWGDTFIFYGDEAFDPNHSSLS